MRSSNSGHYTYKINFKNHGNHIHFSLTKLSKTTKPTDQANVKNTIQILRNNLDSKIPHQINCTEVFNHCINIGVDESILHNFIQDITSNQSNQTNQHDTSIKDGRDYYKKLQAIDQRNSAITFHPEKLTEKNYGSIFSKS